jgi:repressor of nif and glnA expression
MNMQQIMREDARLTILKTLAEQDAETLNSNMLTDVLKIYGIRKTRAWVHDELRYLHDMGAVTLIEAGSVLIASLTEKGRMHLDRDIAIEGVKRPSRPEA